MKRYMLIPLFFIIFFASASHSDDFLGAPIIPAGEISTKTEKRIEIKTGLNHEEALMFYKKFFEGNPDIKYRDWKKETYIEDDGSLDWHSIIISKGEKDGTTIIISKDSWTWIIGTLVLRYIGVFVVLLLLFVGMSISGKIISRMVIKTASVKAK